MKRIGLSQRVADPTEHGEIRDCLDQCWTGILESIGMAPIPLSNAVSDVAAYLDSLGLDGVILSGGNDPAALPEAVNPTPGRDRTEDAIVDYCTSNGVPVLGVCRGMQFLNLKLGGTLRRVSGHVAERHSITTGDESRIVNSYHNWGIAPDDLAPDLVADATDEDGFIECFRHATLPIAAIMWHPEREAPYAESDKRLMHGFFSGDGQ